MMIDASILIAARVLGTLVFATALIGKLRHRDEFIAVVSNYRLVPERLAPFAAWLVIALETASALSLASGYALEVGSALAICALGIFATAMIVNLARGRTQIDCGCFRTTLRQRLSRAHVVRNALLVIALAPLLLSNAVPASLSQTLDGLGMGLVLFVLYLAFDRLLALRAVAAMNHKRTA